MLLTMPQPASSTPTPGPASFAGLLAALTSSAKPAVWDNDGLADDVATLSYERALQAHSRYKPPDLDEQAFLQRQEEESVRSSDSVPAEAPLAVPEVSSAAEPNLKNASVTIRLSKAECVQLRQRAAEAGLTVSAYMRSCAFETETLRALVKDTLAQMRSQVPGQPDREAPRGLRGWLSQRWPRIHCGRRPPGPDRLSLLTPPEEPGT